MVEGKDMQKIFGTGLFLPCMRITLKLNAQNVFVRNNDSTTR